MCCEYDEQRHLSCCEAIRILQIEGGMGKNSMTDGNECVYSVAQSQDGDGRFDQCAYLNWQKKTSIPVLLSVSELRGRLARALGF